MTSSESKIKELKTEARKLQNEQFNLIGFKKNPRRFGEITIELEIIWQEIGRLSLR